MDADETAFYKWKNSENARILAWFASAKNGVWRRKNSNAGKAFFGGENVQGGADHPPEMRQTWQKWGLPSIVEEKWEREIELKANRFHRKKKKKKA